MSSWCKPLDLEEDEEDDELQVGHEYWEDPEEGATASHLSFQRLTSRVTQKGRLNSDRVWRNVHHSQMEFSLPSTSIRSQVPVCSSSRRPLQRHQAPSLMSWTPIASLMSSKAISNASESPKQGRFRGGRDKLTG
nr:movement protein [cacao leafroll virus]